MRLYNLNASSTEVKKWILYNKNYIKPLSYNINTLFDYILQFQPDYDILNSDNRNNHLEANHNFMKQNGLYWYEKKNASIAVPISEDPTIDLWIKDEEGKLKTFDTQQLDLYQGWIFTQQPPSVKIKADENDNSSFVVPRNGDIFIKTAPVGSYGGYWVPQGNMGLYLPSFNQNKLIFTKQRYENESQNWAFNFDVSSYRFVSTDIVLKANETIYNNINGSMIWSFNKGTTTADRNLKLWTGQPLMPQLKNQNGEEIITEVSYNEESYYVEKQYYNIFKVNIDNNTLTETKIRNFNWKLEVC